MPLRAAVFAATATTLAAWSSLPHIKLPLAPQVICRRCEHLTSTAADPEVPPLLVGRSNTAAIWRVAWPSVAIGLLRTALGQIDAWYIGRLGSRQLEAIGAASFAVWLVYVAGELSSVGVHALSSAAEGAGDRQDGVGAAVVQGMWFSMASSLVIALVLRRPGVLERYFRGVGLRDPLAIAEGADYLRVTALGALPLSASACASAGFKGIGETVPALAIAAGTVVCNIALNGPFIRTWGVAGAAHATNLAAALGCLASLVVLKIRYSVRLSVRLPSLRALTRIGRIGVPLASSGALFSAVYMSLGRTLAGISPRYLAALGIGHRLEAVAYTCCEGYAVGTATVVGQWAGARRPARARQAAHAAAVASALTMLPIGALCWATAAPAAALFTGGDVLMTSAAASYLRIVALAFPMMAIEAVYEGALTGIQKTGAVFLVGLVLNVGRIPLAMWLTRRWGTVEGVWVAIAISTALKGPIKWWCFQREKVEPIDLRSTSSLTNGK